MKYIFIILTALIINHTNAQSTKMKELNKNDMTVRYSHRGDTVSFQLSAPTTGWVAIGFNEYQRMEGSHLIMCRIINGIPEVIEHYTSQPGRYKPIIKLGGKNAITNISGTQDNNNTSISFNITTNPIDQYHKDLSTDKEYYIILAYSQSDDFQHHSIMRTTIKSIL